MELDSTQHTYYTDCGKVPEGEKICCGVCQSTMDVTRNAYGPRGFAMAMSGSKTHYDLFTCPRREAEWHKQVVALRQEAKRTPSRKIEMLLLDEAKSIMLSEQATKTEWRTL